MKLLIATGLTFPDIGGPATYTAFLEAHLPEKGIEVSVVSFRDVRRYPKLVRHFVYLVRLLRSALSCDVVYALDTVSVGVPAWVVSVLLRKPLLLRVPGDYAWEQGQQRFGVTEMLDEYLISSRQCPWQVRLLAWFQYRVARHAEQVIVPSDYMKSVVAKWGVNPEKVVRIYSALKVIEVTGERGVLRAKHGLHGFVIVTAARLVPWKGIRALIDVLADLKSEGSDVTLEVIGDGVERAALERYAHERGVEDSVHFRGVLPRNELGEFLRAGDVFVLNTAYEGLSHQLIEAMSLGVPIVTTPVGGNQELIRDHVDGLFVPYNDVTEIKVAIRELQDNPELVRSFTANAREQTALFHEDVVIEEFVKLLQTL